MKKWNKILVIQPNEDASGRLPYGIYIAPDTGTVLSKGHSNAPRVLLGFGPPTGDNITVPIGDVRRLTKKILKLCPVFSMVDGSWQTWIFEQGYRMYWRRVPVTGHSLEQTGTRVCHRCGTPVTGTRTPGYSYYCPEHDEDLYEFETDILNIQPKKDN